jgi:hypothetical protein
MSNYFQHRITLALVLIGVGTVAGCRERGDEKAKAECVRNMTILWGAAGSYCLEKRKTADFVCSPEMLSGYMKDGHPSRCPLGEKDYAPFTASTGPRCPNRPDVHMGHTCPK